MTSRFDTIFESNFTRMQGGGYLTGDIIKFKEGWESEDWCKDAPAQVLDKIRELAASDLILRVSSVQAVRPSVNSSVDQASGVDGFFLDIAQETAPGYWNGHFLTVPQQLVELGNVEGPPEVPESLKRKDDVDLKPKELTGEDTEDSQTEDLMNDPVKQTGMSDKTNRRLADKNTKLPGVTGANSYTAKYIS